MGLAKASRHNLAGRAALYLVCGFVFFFLVVPILIVIPISFSSSPYMEFPPSGFSLQWYQRYFNDPVWLNATWHSFKTAILTMVLATILGTAAAFSLIRGKYPCKDLINAFLATPMIVPLIIISIAFYFFFAKYKLIGSLLALVCAHSVLAIPFVVSNVSASLRLFDPNLEYAALSLGANKLNTFVHVILPMIRPGVVSGALFAFIISFDEIVVSMFLCGRNFTLPKKMFDNIKMEIDPTIAAVSTLLILLSFLILTRSTLFASKGEQALREQRR